MFVDFSKVIDKKYCAVFIWYKKCWRAPLGAVEFLDYINVLESIEFLFEREFMYACIRKWSYRIWFCIWFRFNILGLTMPCA